MTPFVQTLDGVLGTLTILAHLALGGVLAGYLFSPPFRVQAKMFGARWGMRVAFITASGAVAASLIYSEVAGYAPCVLCWWQRVFLYPLVPLFGLALLRTDRGAVRYGWALAVPGALLALYHTVLSYISTDGACDPSGVSCAARYVWEFGYITIPLMSFTAFVLVLAALFVARREGSDGTSVVG